MKGRAPKGLLGRTAGAAGAAWIVLGARAAFAAPTPATEPSTPAETQAPPPATPKNPPAPATGNDGDDAWSATIHRGLQDEGAKPRAEAERERAEASEIERRRRRPRILVVGGAGYASNDGIGSATERVDTSTIAGIAFGAGAGLRLGFGSQWAAQIRATLSISDASTKSYYVSDRGLAFQMPGASTPVLLVTPAVEATARFRFLPPAAALFVGLGPKLGGVFASFDYESVRSTLQPDGSTATTKTKETIALSSPLVASVVEIGGYFDADDGFELAVRPTFGILTASEEAAVSVDLVAAYAF